MNKTVASIVLECLFDLGVTLAYATGAGLLIVAVSTADNASFLWSLLYASLLPLGVAGLIGFDAVVRIFEERRSRREKRVTPSDDTRDPARSSSFGSLSKMKICS